MKIQWSLKRNWIIRLYNNSRLNRFSMERESQSLPEHPIKLKLNVSVRERGASHLCEASSCRSISRSYYSPKNENCDRYDAPNWRCAATSAPSRFTSSHKKKKKETEVFLSAIIDSVRARLDLSIASFRPWSNVLIGLYISRWRITWKFTSRVYVYGALWAHEASYVRRETDESFLAQRQFDNIVSFYYGYSKLIANLLVARLPSTSLSSLSKTLSGLSPSWKSVSAKLRKVDRP